MLGSNFENPLILDVLVQSNEHWIKVKSICLAHTHLAFQVAFCLQRACDVTRVLDGDSHSTSQGFVAGIGARRVPLMIHEVNDEETFSRGKTVGLHLRGVFEKGSWQGDETVVEDSDVASPAFRKLLHLSGFFLIVGERFRRLGGRDRRSLLLFLISEHDHLGGKTCGG